MILGKAGRLASIALFGGNFLGNGQGEKGGRGVLKFLLYRLTLSVDHRNVDVR